MKKRGFTLIELLIVITLLGILAVAVLSAINPVEQINRSNDTSSRSDAEQLINAIDRFYASKGYYPWQTGTTDDEHSSVGFVEVTADAPADNDSVPVPMLTKLTSEGTAEIKESFVSRITSSSGNPLWIYNGGEQGQSTYVCFKPRSANFLDDATNRCNSTGDYEGDTLPDDYPAGACGETIYSCLP